MQKLTTVDEKRWNQCSRASKDQKQAEKDPFRDKKLERTAH